MSNFNKTKWRFKPSLFDKKIALLSCLLLTFPLEAHADQINGDRQKILTTDNAVAFDFFGLFKGAVNYVQIANISDEQEVAIGKQIREQLLSQQYELYENGAVQEYVDRLGQELVNSAKETRDIPYTFDVVVSDAVNAFATPGGFIYLTTGLLQEADNEAQLVSVMAHEIAHIEEKHSIKALKQAAIAFCSNNQFNYF